ncbi:sugar ABC transporter permease [Microbacterium sp. MF43]|nr:sugar ABC transporter permease [Microbacterium sp. MF43]
MIIPLSGSFGISLFESGTAEGPTQYPWDNYLALMFSPAWSSLFWPALLHNGIFFAIQMLVQIPLGLLFAVLLARRVLRLRAAYRASLFSPAVLSTVVAGFTWLLILSPIWGVARDILEAIGLGELFEPWLGLQGSALVTVSLIAVWQSFGVPMMLFLAALVSIPDELIEAARMDGATNGRIFWSVQLPLIAPTVGVIAVLLFAGSMNAFDLIFTLQGPLAGPNYSTDVLGTLYYRTFFGGPGIAGNQAMGATIAGMTVLITVIVLVPYIYFVQRKLPSYAL